MKFTYQNHEFTDVKGLIFNVFQDTGEIVDLDEVLCNGVKWDAPDSDFVKELDMPINRFRIGVEIFLTEIQTRVKSQQVEALKLLKNNKTKNWFQEVLQKALLNPEPGDLKEAKLDLKKISNKAQLLKKQLG